MLTSLALSECGQYQTNESSKGLMSSVAQGIGDESRLIAKATNDFGLNLLSELEEGQVLAAPYSISSALSMTLQGADGETANQMRSTLKLVPELSQKVIDKGFEVLTKISNADKEKEGYELKITNSLWFSTSFSKKLKSNFSGAVKSIFNATAKILDFYKKPEESRQEINDHVEKATNKKIKEILPRDSIKKSTAFVITNAVYFKGKWKDAFDKKKTQKDAPFMKNPAEEIKVSMMKQTNRYQYLELDGIGAKAIKLPYETTDPTKRTSMVVILPDEIVGRDALFSQFNGDMLASVQDQLNTAPYAKINLSLPKWTSTVSYELSESLKKLGMQDAFDEFKANFTKMASLSPNEHLWISKVFHKVFVEVTEEGTEAAGATAVVGEIMVTSLRPPEVPIPFTVDRPFLYFIQDDQKGLVHFIGFNDSPESSEQ